MEKKNLVSKIVWWLIYAILVAGTVMVFIFQTQMEEFFAQTVSDNPTLQWMYSVASVGVIKSIQVIVIAIACWYVIALIAKISIHSKKGTTIAKLLVNFVKWVIAIASIFIILSVWGANTTFMLASAGVVTLVIGLGSQALVADILAGVFIVFEGDFQVGDIIIIDGWRGEVQSIGIRTTRLVDAGGNVKIITNSDIKTIINQSKELSIAKCYVGVSYNDRIEHIEKIIADNIDKLKDKIPDIVEGPFYKGVAELNASSVDLLFVAKCNENDIYQVQRDLNREIKILFDDNNISIPFPQVTVSYEEKKDFVDSVTKKVKNQSEEFVEEQKELSKDIDIKK